MKINFIMPGLGDSGGIKVVKKYAEELSARGNDVVIYCPFSAYNLHRYKNTAKNYVHKIYCTGKTLVQKKEENLKKWIWAVNDRTIRDADITVATMWATAYDVIKLSKSKGKKFYFVQGFEIWDNKEWGLNSYKLPLQKIVISTWINNQLIESLGIGPFPVVINGMDRELFYDRQIRDDSKKIFLMLNHTLEKKGIKYGLEVFERVRKKYPDSKLKMFGMCDNCNLPDYVEYFQNPSKETLINLYSSANYFIFPSLEEGWGLTPIEAMSCGCIVFGTKTGFVLDIGKHKENMMISVPGNVDGMVSNIEEVLEQPELQHRIRRDANITIKELNWEISANRLEKLFADG